MIVKNFEIDKIKSANLNIHLIYGNNEAAKQDIIYSCYINKFNGEILKYDELEILNDSENFISSLLNKSLFETDKLIIISRTSEKILNILESIIEKNISDIKIIIKASVLEKKSKLRNFSEKSQQVICTPVYEDDARTLGFFAQKFLRENNLKFSQEIINILIDRSKSERTNLKNELMKLKNLSISKKNIVAEDVIKLSNLAENFSVFELSDNYLAKNTKKVANILNENNYSSEDCILIIKTILNKSKRLLKIRNEIDKSESIDHVIQSFKPPIFWKEKDLIKKQVKSWSTSEIKELIYKVNGLEALVKKNSTNSIIFVCNFVSNY